MSLKQAITNFLHYIESDAKKVDVLLLSHKEIVEGVIIWAAKEYVALDGTAKLAKAIDIVETLINVPAIVEAYTPELVQKIQDYVQKTYDELKAENKI